MNSRPNIIVNKNKLELVQHILQSVYVPSKPHIPEKHRRSVKDRLGWPAIKVQEDEEEDEELKQLRDEAIKTLDLRKRLKSKCLPEKEVISGYDNISCHVSASNTTNSSARRHVVLRKEDMTSEISGSPRQINKDVIEHNNEFNEELNQIRDNEDGIIVKRERSPSIIFDEDHGWSDRTVRRVSNSVSDDAENIYEDAGESARSVSFNSKREKLRIVDVQKVEPVYIDSTEPDGFVPSLILPDNQDKNSKKMKHHKQKKHKQESKAKIIKEKKSGKKQKEPVTDKFSRKTLDSKEKKKKKKKVKIRRISSLEAEEDDVIRQLNELINS